MIVWHEYLAFWRVSLKGSAFALLCALPWVGQAEDADRDGDGLIEIDNLTMLHNMRHDRRGWSYKTSWEDGGNRDGCPLHSWLVNDDHEQGSKDTVRTQHNRCHGYELTRDLDFDADGDGSTWSRDSSGNYSLDEDDSVSPYFVVSNGAGGWIPIGGSEGFRADFEGNGYTISNLAIRRGGGNLVGFFTVTDRTNYDAVVESSNNNITNRPIYRDGIIRNIGLINNLADYTGTDNYVAVGGLVGRQNRSRIIASYATGHVNGGGSRGNIVGGLVGGLWSGEIHASHARGAVTGGNGISSRVGGLVGEVKREGGRSSHILASYAKGNVDSGGHYSWVGGLVGWNEAGWIRSSYATGRVTSGDGVYSHNQAGGLVGHQAGGKIFASYATGDVDGGAGDGDHAGRLVGRKAGGLIEQSYGFGGLMGGESAGVDGDPPVFHAADLTRGNVGSSWDSADRVTLGAWDFGTNEQVPLLNYADYDGGSGSNYCSQFPSGSCGTLLPGQAGVSAGDSFSVQFGTVATLNGSLASDRGVEFLSWHWRQLQGPPVDLRGADSHEPVFVVPGIPAPLLFMLTAIDSEGWVYSDHVTVLTVPEAVDEDGDGLIEIHDLTMLHNMRYDLAGLSYRTSPASAGDSSGCPFSRCIGYELVQPLNFDTDGDGTWSGDSSQGYSLDEDDSRAPYFVVDSAAGGWQPIGDGAHPFIAVFEGNGHSVGDLAIRRDQASVGLFGVIGEGAAIRNFGLVGNLADYTGSSSGRIYIGGLVGRQKGGAISAGYATGVADGGSGSADRVGGLVGWQEGGLILASYARGDVDGGGGWYDHVGGLVGQQENGSITASYATAAVAGGSGAYDRTGGLVGEQDGGSITASYATGAADGGPGKGDFVGGLVGWQDGGSIAAGYATGDVDGGDGSGDWVGGLVGRRTSGSIRQSYGFGGLMGGESVGVDGDPPVSRAVDLTATHAASSWNAAANNTLGAWDFGSDEQVPALKYADYDGEGAAFNCNQFLPGACGTLFPGQDEVSAGDSSEVRFGAATTLIGSLAFDRVAIGSWHWRQLQGPPVPLRDADSREATFWAPNIVATLVFMLTAIDSEGWVYSDRVTLTVDEIVDEDGDGLIEIYNLTMLHNMRYDLAGRSYKTSVASVGASLGCPDQGCIGYELVQPLDFDTDADGTWSGDSSEGYSLDVNDSRAPYFEVNGDGEGGWLPIGDGVAPFVAVFEGNGHRIGNLAIRRDQSHLGLFGALGEGAAIRNLGLVGNLADYTGASDEQTFIGGLAGRQQMGTISASYATGAADGGDGDGDVTGGLVGLQEGGSIVASYARGNVDGGGGYDWVGGLVGRQQMGTISASYATGDADGGDGDGDVTGGLVGLQEGGSIVASYARGNVDGGGGYDWVGGLVGRQEGGLIMASHAAAAVDGGMGWSDRVGGLVGLQRSGLIIASYATGDVDGGAGWSDQVGGLVGRQEGGSIVASYATGEVAGGDGDEDKAGGLVGYQENGSITASYATGAADGGSGNGDEVGRLIGLQGDGSIWQSYGFGGFMGGESAGADGAPPVSGAADLTATHAASSWNAAGSNTLGAWDFGTNEQFPVLNYADYDGEGAAFNCNQFLPGACGTLLPGQGDLSAGDASEVLFGAAATLTGSLRFGRVAISSWHWRQLQGPPVPLRGADSREATFWAPENSATLVFMLTAIDGKGQAYSDRVTLFVRPEFADEDGDGLIEIDDLTMLHDMRYDLAGRSYKSSAASVGNSTGCPVLGCFGYELVQPLDFDTDDDGTWSGGSGEGYSLDGDDSMAPYFEVNVDGEGGWRPIGDEANPFAAVFDGNGHRIGNLAIRRNQASIGLFGVIGEGAAIRNLGLVGNLADYTGSSDGEISIGGLVGRQSSGAISASSASGTADGGSGSRDRVGGLVGLQEGGSITASYARGNVDGGVGNGDSAGGLVGLQVDGSITASYAMGDAADGDGNGDNAGGLVGYQKGGSITASYATGDAAGGDGNGDNAGGLVGYQKGGSITASYARGSADGGSGGEDEVGRLIGLQGDGSIWQSYGFGGLMGGESAGADGAPPVSSAADLTATHAGSFWNTAGSNTLGAWDFGSDEQFPVLNYADYDGGGAAFNCNQFLPGACGTLLPGQAGVSADGSSAVPVGGAATLSGLLFSRVAISSWHWRQLQGATVTLRGADSREATFWAPENPATLVFMLTAIDGEGQVYSDRVTLFVRAEFADEDGDGLIEIHDLTMLHNMRYDLAGLSYKSSPASDGDSSGCPSLRCIGYELMQPLDFDTDGDGTWSGDSSGGYSLDGADSRAPYFVVNSAAGGWQPIGDRAHPFAAVFDGNGHSIGNLAIRRDQASVGLFGVIGEGAAIRNLGLVDNLADYTGSGDVETFIGGLVGWQNSGSITASYATGVAAGGSGTRDWVGGLVGFQEGGSITASYATGAADGGGSYFDHVGGLVGLQEGGSIRASYATGAADGGDGDSDSVGGLVGSQRGGSITASYATGAADGGDGVNDQVGGLVGSNQRDQRGGSITASYGFGVAAGRERGGSDGSRKPRGVSTAAQLTTANVGVSWNAVANNTWGAWDFGSDEQVPLLNYADYDGGGAAFSCNQFPPGACGTLLPGQAGVSADGSSAVPVGAAATLSGLLFGRVAISSWHWLQLQGPPVTLRDADSREATFLAPDLPATLVFVLTAIDGEGQVYSDRVTLFVRLGFADEDGDGLIEIHDLTMLHNMRYDLAGLSYKSSPASVGDSSGCPSPRCIGYELMQPLDFDTDGDGTWSGDSSGGYSLDGDDSRAPYFVVNSAAGGWQPIGDRAHPFAAVFDGNGHSIGNLAIRRDQASVGLFGVIGEGAAIRNLGLVGNLADYTGSSDNEISIGGLVGRQNNSSITASYATGVADGGPGNSDIVGGLVGYAAYSSITASYTKGDVDGGIGDYDRAGGLVGYAAYSSITASYARGSADGGVGNRDSVGGLVGRQVHGSITASYATGVVDGGVGNRDIVGGLVGVRAFNLIRQSYGFGGLMGGEIAGADGAPPVPRAADLTATHAGSFWNAAANNTLGAWDFGSDEQVPVLNYADYDGGGAAFNCKQFLPGACGTLLPGQGDLSVGGPLQFGATATLSGSLRFGRVSISSWHWRQLQGPTVALTEADTATPTFRVPAPGVPLVFELTASASDGREYRDRITLVVLSDSDGDGLIEIQDLTMLHNMRYDLAGTSYRTSAAAEGNPLGCPQAGCHGYELNRDLDFDTDDDGTWSGDSSEGYSLDVEDSRAPYFEVNGNGEGGWQPIGEGVAPFVAVFEGNGHSIGNLAIRRDQTRVGLFGVIGEGAAIRNLGLVDNLADYTGSSDDEISIGGLVGWQGSGLITASYATGVADGGDGNVDSVGGLVGRQESGLITASYATGVADGGDGNVDSVGGLVGNQRGGSITASYATGAADGGDGGFDKVGGLVGEQREGGSITASYATGAADGGDGDFDKVGGLVGEQREGGSITASYATGAAGGGGGGGDRVGGLVGRQGQGGGSITASYATGDADGGKGGDDAAGGLVGERGTGTITVSYGFGEAMGEGNQGSDGSPKPAVPGGSETITSAAQLTAEVAGSAWNAADSYTLGAWDFSDEGQIPVLNYADYDGGDAAFNCKQFLPGACGTLLPGQADVSVGAPPALQFGATATLTGSLAFGRVSISSWHWRQLQGPTVALTEADTATPTFRVPAPGVPLVFELTASASDGHEYRERITLVVLSDSDGDGLIEIQDLTMLHNMRYDLAGTSYRTSATAEGNPLGCPQAGCHGYELIRDLNFDSDGDGTWSGDSSEGYSLDVEDSRAPYFEVNGNGEGGWQPIGDSSHPFVAVFEGNGHSIGNLAIRRDQIHVGLFGRIGEGAAIRNLGLVDNLADYTGSSDDEIFIGGLVGWQEVGLITASYATGAADGGGGRDSVGGLVGLQRGGMITASYATGVADGGDGAFDWVGGLVGLQRGGMITASYARGAAGGGDGSGDRVGGLVGQQERGSITASYATGAADGGGGDRDNVGGLVGRQTGGLITASYATGSAGGGDGSGDRVGGLVGFKESGSITASYATGAADGGIGGGDYAGGLLGQRTGGSSMQSYGYGVATGEYAGSDGLAKLREVSTAAALTAANAGASWNNASNNTLGAWDFGTDEQVPALNYADYDGLGAVFNCDQFPTGVCAAAALLPGQAELSAGDSSRVLFGAAATLTGSLAFGRVAIRSWHWRQLQGPPVTLRNADSREATFWAPNIPAALVFVLTAIDGEGQVYSDRVILFTGAAEFADEDGNGLIEIHDLTMLHNMRYDLAGTSYRISAEAGGNTLGCPQAGCHGYELNRDLDFDIDDDGTWSGNSNGVYSLDEDDSRRHTLWSIPLPAAGSRLATAQIPLPPSLTATVTASATSPFAAINLMSGSLA